MAPAFKQIADDESATEDSATVIIGQTRAQVPIKTQPNVKRASRSVAKSKPSDVQSTAVTQTLAQIGAAIEETIPLETNEQITQKVDIIFTPTWPRMQKSTKKSPVPIATSRTEVWDAMEETTQVKATECAETNLSVENASTKTYGMKQMQKAKHIATEQTYFNRIFSYTI